MSQFFQIHPDNPQPRLISQTVAILRAGGLIVYPTDSCYALGWEIDNKAAMERAQTIRQTEKNHVFTLVCRDLSDIAAYARIDNAQYRLLRAATPGPFTFVLQATRDLPRRLASSKRRTVGIRVPDHPIVQALLAKLERPLMSSTLILPGETLPVTDPEQARERLQRQVDLIIDGGNCGTEPTTVVDISDQPPRLLRPGKGDASAFLG